MRASILLVAFFLGFVPAASAGDDVSTAQAVITSQVEAMGRDDAATAYSYAAPALQGIFGQPDVFMAMVKKNYAPVYRHKSFKFGESRAVAGQVAQKVDIIDADGEAWVALYTLEQQSDGSVKISGCMLVKAGQSV